MEDFHRQLGRERGLDENSRSLRYHLTRQFQAPAVGALHVTCADESEHESVESFQKWFAHHLLPPMRFSSRSPMRLANLGGRYEWGAVALTEDHFTTAASRDAFKVIVVKVNSHVGVTTTAKETRYGPMERYDHQESVTCGALHALLDHAHRPFTGELEEAFASEGLDRIACLNDPEVVPQRYKNLLASVVQARLQARRALVDVQDHRPVSPTVYLIVPCVTLNRADRDTEILCGLYTADMRDAPEITYQGLGDDPSTIVVAAEGPLELEGGGLDEQRPARDHRELVGAYLSKHPKGERHPGLCKVLDQVKAGHQRDHKTGLKVLAAALPILAILDPIPTALMAFAQGLVGVHHLYRAHRLSRENPSEDDARKVLSDLEATLENLPPAKVQRALDRLAGQYGGAERHRAAPATPSRNELGPGS